MVDVACPIGDNMHWIHCMAQNIQGPVWPRLCWTGIGPKHEPARFRQTRGCLVLPEQLELECLVGPRPGYLMSPSCKVEGIYRSKQEHNTHGTEGGKQMIWFEGFGVEQMRASSRSKKDPIATHSLTP